MLIITEICQGCRNLQEYLLIDSSYAQSVGFLFNLTFSMFWRNVVTVDNAFRAENHLC